MRALDHKLLRDLWQMRGQALAIVLVIASGVSAVLMSLSTLDSLKETRERYYLEYGFPDLFVSLKRAPEGITERIEALPGVAQVQARVLAPARLEVPGFDEPVSGLMVSRPSNRPGTLNRLRLRKGRMGEPQHPNEVVLSDSFAEAQGLGPGDRLTAVVNGRRQTLTIVGTALSPEYIYQIGPGQIMPDFKRFGVLWQDGDALAASYDMDGACNDIAVQLSAGASAGDIIERIDDLLRPYGGLGANDRDQQLSHRFLSEEFEQLAYTGRSFSVIFITITAFLMNMVMSRLIQTQREQIAALKAFGYSNLQLSVHYAKLISAIVVLGLAAGIVAGVWLGQGLANLYTDFYRLPYLDYRLRPSFVAGAALVTIGTALFGAFFALRKAVRLPPAQAMQPEPPEVYRATVLERLGLQRWFSQPSRMVLRHIERRPFKALASMLGIAMACGLMIAGTFFNDAIDAIVDAEFIQAQREDLSVSFNEAIDYRASHELAALPGVRRVEPYRSVPVWLEHGRHREQVAIEGFEHNADLHRILNARRQPVALPADGLLLSTTLAGLLGVQPGEQLQVRVLEGQRQRLTVPVTGLTKQFIGTGAYMHIDGLNRLLEEGRAISGAFLAVDADRRADVYTRLAQMPAVAGTRIQSATINAYYETMAEVILRFVAFITSLAAAISFAVVYISARIALSERGRELASLRVLGFSRGEAAYILLGELAVLTVLAIPLGFAIGRWLSWQFVQLAPTELFRIPLVLQPDTYALAATVILLSALISAIIVRRRLNRLDLIDALKTKE